MSLFTCLLAILSVLTRGQQLWQPVHVCVNPRLFEDAVSNTDVVGHWFLTLNFTGFLTCVRQCLLRSRCYSLVYRARDRACGLHYWSSAYRLTNKTNPGTLYTEIRHWKHSDLVGRCTNHGCDFNSFCNEQGEGPTTCKTEFTKTKTIRTCNFGLHHYPMKSLCLKNCKGYGYDKLFLNFNGNVPTGQKDTTEMLATERQCRTACLDSDKKEPCVIYAYKYGTSRCVMSIKNWFEGKPMVKLPWNKGVWSIYVRRCGSP